MDFHPVVCAQFTGSSAPLFGDLHGLFKPYFVQFKSLFTSHQCSQVQWKSKGVVQFEYNISGQALGRFEFCHSRL